MAPRSAADRIITDDRYRGRGCRCRRRRRRHTKTHIVFLYIVLDFPYVFLPTFFSFPGDYNNNVECRDVPDAVPVYVHGAATGTFMYTCIYA